MKDKNSFTILSQLNRNQQKPQISSVRGVHPRERYRYRVTVEDTVLGDHLTIDEALELAKGGAK